MKKLMLFFLTFYSLSALQAQIYVNKKDINQLTDIVYIEVIIDSRAFRGGRSFAILDYGQLIRGFTARENRITNERGEDELFNGEMDVFNFLHRKGWIHETTYAKEAYVYHIFRRKGVEK
ncbi:MAG: hypothetical protein NW226_05320 [Microscillaceae bacterium]|nr:hypothetical protein [Microscillaceae bacterium]